MAVWGERALGQRGRKLGRGVDWAARAAWFGANLGRERSSGQDGWSSGRGRERGDLGRAGPAWERGLGWVGSWVLLGFLLFLILNFSIPNSNKV